MNASGDQTWLPNGIVELRRRDADDQVRLAFERDGAADELRVGREAALPQGIRDDGDPVAPGLRLLGEEAAADGDADAHRLEERRAHLETLQPLRLGLAGDRRVPPFEGHQIGGAHLALEVDEVGRRHLAPIGERPGLRRDAEDLHQAIDVAQREGAQDEAVDQRQHGGIGGEADRQRQHDDEGEGGLVRQQARGEAEVTPETGHERISWNREGRRGRPPGAMARDEHPAGDAGRLPPVPRGSAEASAGAPLGEMLLGEIAEDGVRGRRGPDQPPEQPFGQARRAAVSHRLHCRQNTPRRERKFHPTPEWSRDDSGVVAGRLRSRR